MFISHKPGWRAEKKNKWQQQFTFTLLIPHHIFYAKTSQSQKNILSQFMSVQGFGNGSWAREEKTKQNRGQQWRSNQINPLRTD